MNYPIFGGRRKLLHPYAVLGVERCPRHINDEIGRSRCHPPERSHGTFAGPAAFITIYHSPILTERMVFWSVA